MSEGGDKEVSQHACEKAVVPVFRKRNTDLRKGTSPH